MAPTPDFFHALTGWRKFSVRDRGRVLVSVNHPIPWPTADPGPACCLLDPAMTMQRVYDPGTDTYQIKVVADPHPLADPCPSLTCGCGYYAYKERAHAEAHGDQGTLLARVELWGRLVEHARGWRAERMKLAEIFVGPEDAAVAALEARYQVPVTRVEPVARTIEGELWTSANRNASSSSSRSANLPRNFQFQTFLNPSPLVSQNPCHCPQCMATQLHPADAAFLEEMDRLRDEILRNPQPSAPQFGPSTRQGLRAKFSWLSIA